MHQLAIFILLDIIQLILDVYGSFFSINKKASNNDENRILRYTTQASQFSHFCEKDNHENYINETRIMLNLQPSHLLFFAEFFAKFTEYIPHIRCGPSLIDVIKIDRSEWRVSGRDDDDRVIRAHTCRTSPL